MDRQQRIADLVMALQRLDAAAVERLEAAGLKPDEVLEAESLWLADFELEGPRRDRLATYLEVAVPYIRQLGASATMGDLLAAMSAEGREKLERLLEELEGNDEP